MIAPGQTFGFVRRISRALVRCELRHLSRQTFDLELAATQHASYVAALESAGVALTVLPEEPALPDSTFVEDPVVVLDEIAILGRPGTPSREPEVERIRPFISGICPVRSIVEPGTLEGGDVLRVGKTLYVGISSRTNKEGVRQLEALVADFGYDVVRLHVDRCLHLKTGVTSPAEGLVLANTDWIDPSPFRAFEVLRVPTTEPWGANTLAVNGVVLAAASSPRSADLLESKGLKVTRLNISELQKAEAGLTCLSVLFHSNPWVTINHLR